MRTPTAKGLASMGIPASYSIWNVSRALWPGASTTARTGRRYVPSPDVQPRQDAFPALQSLQPVAEAYLRPQRQQLLPQVLQSNVQHIRPHMGLGIRQNTLRRAASHQLL